MQRSVDRALRFEYFVCPFRRCDFVRVDLFQRERHVDPPEHQHTFLDFDFAARDRRQPISACHDLARLQRAPQRSEQSTTCRRDDIINGRRVWIRHLPLNAVMAGDRPMSAEPDGL
jgi:hypothetical protein